MEMKMIGYIQIKGTINVVTGLHIGGSTAIIEIGGKDNPVIKHPITKEPYIPGSSLKGKMRSLLEWTLENKIESNGAVHKWCGDNKCPICLIFGTSADEADLGPTRLIVRDAFLDKKYKEDLKSKNPSWIPADITEDKYENTINRITAHANPRNFERVVSGAKFSLDMTYRVFQNGSESPDDDKMVQHILDGLKMVEMDALGGAGSRGCGQVEFMLQLKDGTLKAVQDIKPTDFELEKLE